MNPPPLSDKLKSLEGSLSDWKKASFGLLSADLWHLERRIRGIHSSDSYHTSLFLSTLEFKLKQEYHRKRLQ